MITEDLILDYVKNLKNAEYLADIDDTRDFLCRILYHALLLEKKKRPMIFKDFQIGNRLYNRQDIYDILFKAPR